MHDPRPHLTWHLRTRSFVLGQRTLLMGILNLTPDSFSDHTGQIPSVDAALQQAETLLADGADLLDLGAESTRPNATPLSPDEEQDRLLPTLEALHRQHPEAILSVDTYHAATAEAALEAGAEIINDVSGLLWDPGLARVLAQHAPGLVLSHTRGTPREWRDLPPLAPAEIPTLVRDQLSDRLQAAHASGIHRENIILDPGFGFGKIGAENYPLLAHLADLHILGRPVLVGISRKGFLARTVADALHLEAPPAPADRLHPTTAANVAAILAGAHILRVHDLRPAREAAAVADAILDAVNPQAGLLGS